MITPKGETNRRFTPTDGYRDNHDLIFASNDLNSIKARVGSLSSSAIEKLPEAVQKLLTVDLPRLIKKIEDTYP